jgi:hypothetical protein
MTYPRNWYQLPESEQLHLYDKHNGVTRLSADRDERMYGKCGCIPCSQIRKTWQHIVAPINQPGRDNRMSSILICDRCGAMVTGNAVGAVTIVASGEQRAERFAKDLCPGCIGDVMDLLAQEHPVTPRERAYRKGWVREEVKDEVGTASAEQLAGALFEKLMIEAGKKERESKPSNPPMSKRTLETIEDPDGHL